VGEWILAPYRALDLTDEKGFLCGKILADLGADVIKVEPPGGDPSRRWGPFHRDTPHPEGSLYWLAYNANKRGITLNLETADGRQLFRELARRADFVIESFPPGYLDSLGLGYEELRRLNPRLILTSITPFGQKGPYRDYRASDITIMALSGFMSLLGDPDRPPVRTSLPQSYLWGSAFAALGTLMAHYHRERTGEGQHVDASLCAGAAWALSFAPLFWPAMRVNPKRKGVYMTGRSTTGAIYPAIHQAKDGYVSWLIYWGRAGAQTHRAMVEWMKSRGQAPQHLVEKDWEAWDPWRATQEELDAITQPVAQFLKGVSKKEFFQYAIRSRMMGYPVSTAEDILDDPQLKAREFWQELPHPELGASFLYPGPFARFSQAQCGLRRPAPRIGEHNREVYIQELGLSPQELVMLKEAGVI